MDPYLYEVDHNGSPRRVDKLRIGHGKGFGRLMNTGTSFSYSLNQDTFKKWFGRDDGSGDDESGDNDIDSHYRMTEPWEPTPTKREHKTACSITRQLHG